LLIRLRKANQNKERVMEWKKGSEILRLQKRIKFEIHN